MKRFFMADGLAATVKMSRVFLKFLHLGGEFQIINVSLTFLI